MNSKHYLGLGVLCLTLFLGGCAKENSSEVEQDRIYTSYSLSYDDTDHSLEATVYFNFGGSTGTYLVLDSASSVAFDGAAMGLNTDLVNQAYYDTSSTGLSSADIWGAHTFVYQNNQGSTYTNQILLPLLPTIQFSVPISASVPLAVNWQTPDDIGGDEMMLTLNKTDGTQDLASDNSVAQSNGLSGTITMSATQLQEVTPGQFYLQVCRWTDGVPASAPSIGGSMDSSSCTARSVVTVTP